MAQIDGFTYFKFQQNPLFSLIFSYSDVFKEIKSLFEE